MASDAKSTVVGSVVQGETGPSDALRDLMGPVIQEAIEREFERSIGAGKWERTFGRSGHQRIRRHFYCVFDCQSRFVEPSHPGQCADDSER